jgi:hypothetical protein
MVVDAGLHRLKALRKMNSYQLLHVEIQQPEKNKNAKLYTEMAFVAQ